MTEIETPPALGTISVESPDGFRMRIVQRAGEQGKTDEEAEVFTSNFLRHRAMVYSSIGSSAASPIIYHIVRRSDRPESSSASMPAIALQHYDSIQAKLRELAMPSPDRMAEVEAAKSALIVVDQLKRQLIAPPEVSWHGGDAIVMLWAIAKRSFAITVTDGELGYVVREDRKTTKIRDAISIDSLKLELFE